MSDETRPTKVYKMVLCFVDHDNLGPEGAVDLLENARYPNHIIGPTVMSIETREVAWNDDHPLNNTETQEAAFEELFGEIAHDEEMDRLRKERDDAAAESERAYQLFPPLLKGVCDALKGVPDSETHVSHDWSDLPEVAAQTAAERDDLRAKLDALVAKVRMAISTHDVWKLGAHISPSAPDALAVIAKLLAEGMQEAGKGSGR